MRRLTSPALVSALLLAALPALVSYLHDLEAKVQQELVRIVP